MTQKDHEGTPFREGRATYFNMRDFPKEDRLNILLASSAIPIIFPKERIGEYYYMDGGTRLKKDSDNEPIRPLYELEHCDFIITLPLVDDALPVDQSKYPGCKIVSIPPTVKLDGMLDFDPQKARKKIDQGYKDTIDVLNKIASKKNPEMEYYKMWENAGVREEGYTRRKGESDLEIEEIFKKVEGK